MSWKILKHKKCVLKKSSNNYSSNNQDNQPITFPIGLYTWQSGLGTIIVVIINITESDHPLFGWWLFSVKPLPAQLVPGGAAFKPRSDLRQWILLHKGSLSPSVKWEWQDGPHGWFGVVDDWHYGAWHRESKQKASAATMASVWMFVVSLAQGLLVPTHSLS